ncbi:MAG: selenocysteine-specific translation elongation factor [Gammaproteobacteria bacterium]|nr:selenocysteine-specific translation elongation factor [Gammaproteobacteria bacterium]
MIIGTAGHIDHGKTALIKALTGVDTDRLAEEKRRGVTIDLGYAYYELPDGHIMGFVDVPGHEKFVHNMLSGALGIDYVLLVIAADDGPMPQTREHLAIMDLLALKKGVVALSKIDRVTPARIEAAEHSIQAMLAGTSLAGADIMRVSAKTGAGVAALFRQLGEVAHMQSLRAGSGQFRLAVDRCFSIKGAGTVVTGTVHAGMARVDDRLLISPAGLSARVRRIRCQNRTTDIGRAGDRCALNLTGAKLNTRAIRRGDWLVAPALHRPTLRLDGRLRVLPSEARVLRHWTPVHVHIGAADMSGRVAILEKESIEPGAAGLVQIVLDKPVPALRGDKFIVRDQSALRTLAGGEVLDPLATARGRRKPQRMTWLAALELPTATAALARLLELRGAHGVDLDGFGLIWNLHLEEIHRLRETCEFHLFEVAEKPVGVAFAEWHTLRGEVLVALADHHERLPAEPGLTEGRLRQLLRDQAPGVLVKIAIDELIAEGAILRHGALLHLPGHVDRLSPIEENLWRRLYVKIDAGGLRPPRPRELAEMFKEDRTRIKALLKRQAKAGNICEISDELYYPPHTIAALAASTEALCDTQGGNLITMRLFREGTGVDRNVTIELLEYFDRVSLTLRVKDGRRLRGSASAIFGAPDTRRAVRL